MMILVVHLIKLETEFTLFCGLLMMDMKRNNRREENFDLFYFHGDDLHTDIYFMKCVLIF